MSSGGNIASGVAVAVVEGVDVAVKGSVEVGVAWHGSCRSYSFSAP